MFLALNKKPDNQSSGRGVYRRLDCKKANIGLDISCSKSTGKFKAQYHQESTLNYFINNTMKSKTKKGLLIYHSLGSGKTCGSILISNEIIKQNKTKKIYVITPGGLRENFIADYCNKCGMNNATLRNNYIFITYNYTVQKRLPNFNNGLVIIDEVHNLINSVKNKSTIAPVIYKALMEADCKILALSATPIYHYIYEWPILGNLLKPNTFVDILDNPADQQRVNEQLFFDQFIENKDGTITPKDPSKYNKKLEGIISYFPGLGTKFYPKVIYEPPFQIPMSEDQSRYYASTARKEAITRRFGPPDLSLKRLDPAEYKDRKEKFLQATQYTKTRRAVNFYYPEKFRGYDVKDIKYTEVVEKIGNTTKTVTSGWIKKSEFDEQQLRYIYSPKFCVLILNIILHPNQKHVIFTNFREKYGVVLLNTLLTRCGIKTGVYSGKVTHRKRKKLLWKFNYKTNTQGKFMQVLLLTSAGAEGITLCEVGHMHILESSNRGGTIRQAIGRVVRYKSHFNMPKKKRVVHIWRYFSIYPTKYKGDITYDDEKPMKKGVSYTVDVKLYEMEKKHMIRVNSFLRLLKKSTVNLNVLDDIFGVDIARIINEYDY